ncbi:aminomethyltransferase family protein [Paenibacillus peoriae]|uniref:aminomethyltransferase family protein n=1 Tax=Paenibacillus peoriae TaxID=59893 RepID=UPI00026C5FEF|nr:aminomethyltransferase family protein [Paenibacillus peoriae]MEC0183788.1 aminomethyltransferase family protein [Paenibacillus peoriae]
MENKLDNVPGRNVEKLPLPIYEPYDPQVDVYVNSKAMAFGSALPMAYSNWRDESMSWKETCYLHTGLNPASAYRVTGPDAMKFFADTCVNSFAKFPIGTLKHAIMCNEEGLIMTHGVLLRVGEEEFITYFLAPYAAYKLESGNYNAKGKYILDGFVFQLAGPKSLEILEAATVECLHDIKFGRHRMSNIEGMEIRITRMGMAGTLAYEVHGRKQDVRSIYNSIMTAGEPFGIRKLGHIAYRMNHTEGGFPQSFVHFPYPWGEDKGFMEFLGKTQKTRRLLGSMGTDIRLRYRNPVELGWEKMIKFDHDFIGREALEKEVANQRRKMVTLVWNPEDILDVYASQYQPGEPYMEMGPVHLSQENGRTVLYADQVLKDGQRVGISSGRTYSYYYRQMLSLCSIDTEHSELGNEVSILWGNPGARQKVIRATVSRFPYLNENRNEHVDVSAIPCRAHKK